MSIFTEDERRKIRLICFDIDDTFSSHGKLTSEAYDSLWALKKAGYKLVPVTGRPAGWCDHIARFWPVDAVVGENGAFSFFMRNGKLERLDTLGAAASAAARARLQGLRSQIETQFPKARFASDQAYREYDLAVDFCEDVAPWTEAEVERLVAFCKSQGAIAKVSSIHVNIWFGAYTKIEGVHALLAHAKSALSTGFPLFEEAVFIGDSPNDEPSFAAFPVSVGVANLKRFLPKLSALPKYLTTAEAGAGFTEFADWLLKT